MSNFIILEKLFGLEILHKLDQLESNSGIHPFLAFYIRSALNIMALDFVLYYLTI